MLKVLYLEDSPQDVEIMRELLKDAGYDLTMDCIATEKEFVSFLRSNTYDIILADYKLPGFDAFGALRRSQDICPDVPLICVSGMIGEEAAVELIRQGAVDYVLKDRLKRLPSAIKRALDEAKEKAALRQAEEALRHERDFAKGVIETVQTIVLVLDTQGHIVRFNPYLEEISGYALAEVQGKDWFLTFVPERHRERIRRLFLDAIGGILTKGNVNPIVTKDGCEREIEWYDKTLKDAQGTVFGLLCSGRDITERKQADEALRESELKLRTVADFTYDWEYWEKENQEIAYISPSCERITGYSTQEFMTDPALFEKIVHPEDVDLVKRSRERVFTTEHKHDVDELEFRIIHKNGSVIHLYHVCRPIFDVSDQYHGRRISNRDITERKLAELASKRAEEELKKSEDKFRTIFDNTSDGMFLVDLNTQMFFMCNAMCMKMLGYTQDEFLALDIADIHPKEDMPLISEQIGKFSRGEEGLRSDIRYKRKNGSIFAADLRPALLTIGEKKYLLINFNDITERKRAEEQIQKSLREKEILLRELYHRTKNNMQVICSMLRLQSNTLKDKRAKELFKEIETRIYSMALVHQKLVGSKDLSHLNLKDYFDSLLIHLKMSYGESMNDISIHTEMADVSMLFDTAIPLGLVFNELISNIVKHAFPDNTGGEIRVQLHQVSRNKIILDISDNGAGFPKEFDMKKDIHFGLEMVIDLVEQQLGGKIDFKSQNGLHCKIVLKEEFYKPRV